MKILPVLIFAVMSFPGYAEEAVQPKFPATHSCELVSMISSEVWEAARAGVDREYAYVAFVGSVDEHLKGAIEKMVVVEKEKKPYFNVVRKFTEDAIEMAYTVDIYSVQKEQFVSNFKQRCRKRNKSREH